MDIVIAGGHGKIARHLTPLLTGRGDRVRSLIRNPDHGGDIETLGAEPVVCDLEAASAGEVTEAAEDADAVVFAAGAGPGSGSERKETMDYGGAAKLIEAARAAGARYLMISSMGADPDREGDDTFDVYQRAKGRADAELVASGVPHKIIRPGGLTDDDPTGRVELGESVARGQIPRADVAAVLAACLANDGAIGSTFEVVSGEVPIEEALAAL